MNMALYSRDIHVDFSETKELMDLLKRHEFHTNKSLGQHFLISQKALKAIVDETLSSSNPVLEIGPGIGVVTRQILEKKIPVTAVELDRRAIKILEETVGDFDNIKIIEDDILKVDLDSILSTNDKWNVVGNLPYYITTPVISRMLEHHKKIDKGIFMVQKEVADRMTALPNNKTYGSLTVFCNLYAECKLVTKVPRGAFMPPPNVDSAVISLTMRDKPLVNEKYIDTFNKLLRAAFQQRRKQITNCLIANLNMTRENAEKALTEAGIIISSRAENLSTEDFSRLSVTIQKIFKDSIA